VVDEDCEEWQLMHLERTVSGVSKYLKCNSVILGTYEQEETFYVAFQRGVVLDRFSSNDNAFDWLAHQNFHGNPEKLMEAFNSMSMGQLSSILKKKYKWESSRLADLAKQFGIVDH
jgi:hypothetical protein